MGTAASAKKPAVSRELAEKEVNGWLDHKNIRSKKRRDSEGSIEDLIEAVQDGYISIDPDDHHLTVILGTPIGSSGQKKELKFKPRITVGELRPYLKDVKIADVEGRLLAYIRGLTGEPEAMIESMDSNDQGLLTTVVLFFM